MWKVLWTCGRSAAEADRHPILCDLIDREPVAGQPVGHGCDVGLRRAEVSANLVGRQPLVVVGRVRIVLAGDEFLEGRLLRRVAAQHQDQVGHGQAGADQSAVVLRICKRVRIALESYKATFVDAIDDADGGRESLCGQLGRKEQGTGQCIEGEHTQICHDVVFRPFLWRQPPRSRKVVVTG